MPAVDLITTHVLANCDGFTALVAARVLDPGAPIALCRGAQDHSRSSGLRLVSVKGLDFPAVTRLRVVDTQESNRLESLREFNDSPNTPVHRFDHHCGERTRRESDYSNGPTSSHA